MSCVMFMFPVYVYYCAAVFGAIKNNKLCGRQPQYAPANCDLDLT